MATESAKDRREAALKIARKLLSTLDKICERKRHGSREFLVDVFEARRSARKLHRLISANRVVRKVDWKVILECTAYLTRIVKEIYTLFNCRLVLQIYR